MAIFIICCYCRRVHTKKKKDSSFQFMAKTIDPNSTNNVELQATTGKVSRAATREPGAIAYIGQEQGGVGVGGAAGKGEENDEIYGRGNNDSVATPELQQKNKQKNNINVSNNNNIQAIKKDNESDSELYTKENENENEDEDEDNENPGGEGAKNERVTVGSSNDGNNNVLYDIGVTAGNDNVTTKRSVADSTSGNQNQNQNNNKKNDDIDELGI